jgi:hypothetical protein
MDPIKGLTYLTDAAHALRIEHGKKYSRHQSRIARHPRGKLSDGEFLTDVIGRLARDEDATARELWNELFGLLERDGYFPLEQWNKREPPKSTLSYETSNCKRRSITFGRFANIISEKREAKNSR